MNRQSPPKAEIDPERAPARAPKNRDELVAENRMVDETDRSHPQTAGEAPQIPTARTEPATTRAVAQDQRDPADVRAGPGDAGGQRSPEVTPGLPENPPPRGRAFPIFVGGLVGLLVVGAVVALI